MLEYASGGIEMTEKELIRRALMGDKHAQAECTEKGIALPCPFCGGNKIKTPYVCGDHFIECSSCHSTSNIVSSREQALKLWNTRPAPPIGRCEECEHYNRERKYCELLSQDPEYGVGDYVEMCPDDYCSYFEPKEESR